ncbi:MAG: AAA family ATPase [Clostridia bacterium]|nr:AAA family ATPase [Clostridia bacterium]
MRILELNIIEFGNIKDKNIRLENGLNIVFGDNEAGKSTVMLFIKFMLYGIPRRTAKSADRDRALNWSTRRASGNMKIEANGKSYRIERRADAYPKNDYLSMICLETGEPVEGEPGEVLLGIGIDAYESSCSIAQMKASEISRAGAASALDNMLVSSDESIDVQKVIKKLDEVRKEYKLNRGEGGIIYQTNIEINKLSEKQKSITEAHLLLQENTEKLERSEKSLSEIIASCESSEELLRQLRQVETLRRFELLDKAKAELEQTNSMTQEFLKEYSKQGKLPNETDNATLLNAYFTYREAQKKLSTRQSQYNSLPSIDKDSEQLASIGEEIEAKCGASTIMSYINSQHKKARMGRITAIACLCLSAVFGALSLVLLPLAIAAGVLVALGISFVFVSAKAKKKRDAACREYGKSFSELEAFLNSCTEALRQKRISSNEIISAKARLDEAEEIASASAHHLVELLEIYESVTDTSEEGLRALTDKHSANILSICEKRKDLALKKQSLVGRISDLEKELVGYDRQSLMASMTIDAEQATPELLAKTERAAAYYKNARISAEEKVRVLREAIIALRARISTSPVELADKICKLNEKLERDTHYYEALVLAMESIEGASSAMSGNVTPYLSRAAGEMMCALSNGKHPSVQTTKDLTLSVDQDGFLISADRLSGGTKDIAYICLRIALMQRLFENELPPLILDEALCQIDDTRTQGVLTALSELCYNSQCILFTCHSRELDICQKIGLPHNEIAL